MQPLLGHMRTGPASGIFPWRGLKPTLLWGYLSLFQAQRALFCLCLKHVHCMAPDQPHCFICPLRGGDKVPFCGMNGVQCLSQLPSVSSRARPNGYGGPLPTTEADLALSLLCVSKVLSYPVLDCVLFLSLFFFLQLQHQDMMGKSVWSIPPVSVTSA